MLELADRLRRQELEDLGDGRTDRGEALRDRTPRGLLVAREEALRLLRRDRARLERGLEREQDDEVRVVVLVALDVPEDVAHELEVRAVERRELGDRRDDVRGEVLGLGRLTPEEGADRGDDALGVALRDALLHEGADEGEGGRGDGAGKGFVHRRLLGRRVVASTHRRLSEALGVCW